MKKKIILSDEVAARMEQLGLSIPDGAVPFYPFVAGTPRRYYAKCSLCDWISEGYEEVVDLEQRVRRHEHDHHCRIAEQVDTNEGG